jgi:hypothetical protein
MSRASVDALPLIPQGYFLRGVHPTFSAFNLGLRDLSRVGKSCFQKTVKSLAQQATQGFRSGTS